MEGSNGKIFTSCSIKRVTFGVFVNISYGALKVELKEVEDIVVE
jgi:hypothetical protein